jgi:hypothetical protein
MEGHIRLGRWLSFQATQFQAPPEGYVWAARTRLGPLPISGYDSYGDGTGEMHWRLLGRVPVMSAASADVGSSAAGRVALDALFVPTTWLGADVTWHDGCDENTAVGEWTVGALKLCVELTVDPDGRLIAATMPRWGNPNREPWGEYPCGGILEGEADYGGIKIPTQMRAGWFFGTDRWGQGEFFRAAITNGTFF